ncbi:MAG: Mut7-C RNAse domain-containing protein [Pseudomonadota bacterium]|nr:Mut7-C RNAse domain-containing protein [Pseudomonadota bacterium]
MKSAIRLLCDEMLASLARWLRAAGHDTELAAPATPDIRLIDQCRSGRRVLLTRDRRLAEVAGRVVTSVLLPPEDLDEQAAFLAEELKLEWLAAPFSRCMVDNELLQAAEAGDFERVLAPARGDAPVMKCPVCARVYWQGGHAVRMLARLRRWRENSLSEKR